MGMPQLVPEQVQQVSELVAQYIAAQRERYRNAAVPLTIQQQHTMRRFFTGPVLESSRLLVLQGARVANPDFYPMLIAMGFRKLPDFSLMAAITYSDVVVSHEPFSDGLLFHELVHIEQYRQLGVPGFAALYVGGFLRGGGYDRIPLEVNAYALGAQFEGAPLRAFSVADEVGAWIRDRRF